MSLINSKTYWNCMTWKFDQKISMPDYQNLETMVKRSIDQNLRLRNFDAKNERSATRAVVYNRRDQRGIERGQGECWQWKASGHFREETSVASGMMRMSALPSGLPTEKDGRKLREESQRPESIWEVRSTAVQRLFEMYLHQITL